MVRSRDVAQAEGEGARRATGVPADGAVVGAGSLAPGQRWSAGRTRDVVRRLLRGESLEALSREAGVEAVDGDRAAPRAGPGRGAAPPCGDAEVATMRETTSAATGRCFGIQRVCQVWECSRAALDARRARAALRTDLARAPFQGEGHRTVHTRGDLKYEPGSYLPDVSIRAPARGANK